jgi:hypothetical protein
MEQRNMIYQDKYAKTVLEEIPAVLEKHPKLICDLREPLPGLLSTLNPSSHWSEEERRSVYETPWGDAKVIAGKDLGTYKLHRFKFYKLISSNPDTPDARMPRGGYATFDLVTGFVAVYAHDDAVPVYHTSIHVVDGTRPVNVLREIRAELARAGVPVYPHTIYGVSELSYPWDEDDGRFRVPRASNDEASTPMVGYALDPETQDVVYLHIAGHKTALRSIWGTLSNGGWGSINCGALRGYNGGDYQTYSSPIDRDTGTYRMIIVAASAVDLQVEESAHMLVADETEIDLGESFAARLNALLPVPVLPQWGEVLMRYGEDDGLLTLCPCDGDVKKAYRITQDGWIELIEQLIQGGEMDAFEIE